MQFSDFILLHQGNIINYINSVSVETRLLKERKFYFWIFDGEVGIFFFNRQNYSHCSTENNCLILQLVKEVFLTIGTIYKLRK